MNNTSKLCLMAASTFLFMACNENSYQYDEHKYEQLQKEQFAKNFVKKYGEVAADQSWDLSGNPMTGLMGDVKHQTRAASDTKVTCTPDAAYAYYNADGYYDIPASTQQSLNKIKENVDNSKMGNTYAMSTPDNNFSIIPLRQGYTTSTYELHMVIGTGDEAVDYLLWSKGQMMQIRKAGSTNAWQNVANRETSYTYGNYDVRAKAITFKDMPVDAPMYFYLYRPTTGLYTSSLDGYVKDFTSAIELPQQLKTDGKQLRVLGVEAQFTGSDYDYEDVMFMIVGDPTLPEDITPLDKLKFSQTVNKRYMIEDLGDTDDTDFNDIVVDVQSSRTISFDYNSSTGEITNRVYGEWGNQTATIRHLGGLLPFQLTIGDTELNWMEGHINMNPNTTHNVSGWNAETNNISIKVKHKDTDQGVNSITFPAVGSVPLIIATNINQPWMEERVSIIPMLKDLIINRKTEK